jgi:hypothetical protein
MSTSEPNIQQKLSDIGNTVSTKSNEVISDLGNTFTDLKNSVSSLLPASAPAISPPPTAPSMPTPSSDTSSLPFMDFSLSKYTNASSEFLESNSLVAKLAFLLLVVFVFFVLLKLISGLMNYFINKSTSNPTKLVDGMINAAEYHEFKQSPKDTNNKTIYRSENADKGIEFTWSVYLFIQDLPLQHQNMFHIFHKGNNNIDTNSGYNTPNNSPGLYIDNANNALVVKMNTFSTIDENVTVTNIPRNKWINVIIRCQNRKIDVYMNGLIAQSIQLSSVPKQNYGSVHVALNNGFPGFISNLWYYNYALTIGEIQRLNNYGPSLQLMNGSGKYDLTKSDYLSLRWYFGNAGDQYIN